MYTIIGTENCQWCKQAKKLFNENNIAFEDKLIPFNFSKEEFVELADKYGMPHAVPLIFNGTELIGGFQDLEYHIEDLNEQNGSA